MANRFSEFKLDSNIMENYIKSIKFVHSRKGDVIKALHKDLDRFEYELSYKTMNNAIEKEVRVLAKRARALLHFVEQNPKSEAVPYCLGAVDYLIDDDDGVPDYASYDGFDDDREVIDEVFLIFGIEDAAAA